MGAEFGTEGQFERQFTDDAPGPTAFELRGRFLKGDVRVVEAAVGESVWRQGCIGLVFVFTPADDGHEVILEPVAL